MEPLRPFGVVGHRRREHPLAVFFQAFEGAALRAPQELPFTRLVLGCGVGDLAGLGFGELPGPKRLVGTGEIVEPFDGAHQGVGRADTHATHRGEEMPGTALSGVAVRAGLGDPTGRQRLAGGADVLTTHEQLHQARRAGAVDDAGFEVAHDRLEGVDRAADLLEHDR